MKRFVWCDTQLIVLVLCGFVSLPAPAFAQPSSLPPRSHGGHLEHLVRGIGLDEKTLAEVSKILGTSKTEHKELRRKLREAHERMRSLLAQEEPDETAVMAQADVIGALETEVQKQQLRAVLQMRALLTPAQRAKLLELLRPRHPRGHRRSRLPEGRSPKVPRNPPSPE